jgi:hypothetical protein
MSTIYIPPFTTEGPGYGTDTWKKARVGRVTASRFGDIMSEPRSKAAKEAGLLSETALGYMLETLASAITGEVRVGGKSAAMDRGVDLEADAIDAYASTKFCIVEPGRLLLRDHDLVAATPDGFIEEDEEGPGLLEVKCPESKTHLKTWLSHQLPEEYVEQVHGQMWVAGRAWCDFVSYDPRFPAAMRVVVIRVHRDEEYLQLLSSKVTQFSNQLAEKLAEIRAFLATASPEQVEEVKSAAEDVLLQPEG